MYFSSLFLYDETHDLDSFKKVPTKSRDDLRSVIVGTTRYVSSEGHS